MKYKMRLLCDEERSLGFQLSSFLGIVKVRSKSEAKSILSSLIKNPEIGLIVVYDDLLDFFDPDIEEMQGLSFPLIVIIPNSESLGRSEDEILGELLRRSIGISVKL